MKRALIVVAACRSSAGPPPQPLVDATLQLLVTPAADHAPFVDAIAGAKASIDLAVARLGDPDVVDALHAAAARGVAVRVMLGDSSKQPAVAGAQLRPASTAFPSAHESAMVVDHAAAFITSIGLTRDAATTRDFGVVTRDAGVVADVEALFDADWTNRAGSTPALRAPSLVVSPTNARGKLVAVLAAAQRDVIATTENLGDPAIANAMIADVDRGVRVRLIVPLCDRTSDPLFDLAPARRLLAAGVLVRMMPPPSNGEDAQHPYMHSNLLQIDYATTYVGSVSWSIESLVRSRELGVIVANSAAAQAIGSAFEADWAAAVVPPAGQPDCPD